jgi:probable HAF family extracellular repeat protein
VNSSGQVVGFASNATDDPNSIQFQGSPTPTQTRAFVWQNGVMEDLDTLGGTDAEAFYINESGQIVGQSYTVNSIANPVPHCGDSPLTLHAFIWERNKMIDLDTLGGSCTFAYALNNSGQVVGQSNLLGDQESHPFIWNRGMMTDLHTLGGTYGYATWLNDSGEVVGVSTPQRDQALLAFYWKDGAMTKLGPLAGDPCSVADAVNSTGQVVGGSGGFSTNGVFPACEVTTAEHAVLWENGQAVDLNAFVPASSNLVLNEAVFINDQGEISGFGSLPNGDIHAFILIPCGGDYADPSGCGSSIANSATPETVIPAQDAAAAVNGSTPAPAGILNRLRGRLSRQYRRFGMALPLAE